ncbi:putative GNAT family N-acetyltransferase [Mycena olivaceomarginata]|nr:putative GNAT family N-acetyltransferase [Mycena olivaceomarginata]
MSAATHLNFHLVPAHTSEAHLSIVRSLFTAYTTWLDLDLTFQNYAAELAALPGAYAPPSGALLLALDTDSSTPLGVIALRPFTYDSPTGDGSTSDRRCELKRLYTVPAARGRGVARALVREALEIARGAGYQVALLDTLEKMKAARGLYASEGFAERGKYYETPLEDTVFMEKRLDIEGYIPEDAAWL